MNLKRKTSIDLSTLSIEELRQLVARAKHQLEIRQFEEGVRQALREYETRDPRVMRG